MNKIEQLLQKYCPDGVGFKSLEKVVNILDNQRKPISRGNRQNWEYPYYWANGIQDYVDDYIFDGTFLLLGEDGSVINKDGSPVLNWATGKIWVNNHAHVLSEKSDVALLRFVFFALSVIDVTKVVKGNIPKITQQDLKNFQIPIPHIEIQKEIVKILDTFTELEARKSQYEHYRDWIFIMNNEVQETSLEEVIITLKTGLNPRKNFILNTEDAENYYVTVRELGGLDVNFFEKTDRVNDDALKSLSWMDKSTAFRRTSSETLEKSWRWDVR